MSKLRPPCDRTAIGLVLCVLIGLLFAGTIAVPFPQRVRAEDPAATTPATRTADLRGMLAPGDTGPEAKTLDDASVRAAGRGEVAGAPVAGKTLAGGGENSRTAAAPKHRKKRRADQAQRKRLGDGAYVIAGSGRLRRSTASNLAYDGDPATRWTSGEAQPAAYAWFDLGARRPISAIRWLAPVASGPLTIQISNDRADWTTVRVIRQPASEQWRSVDVDKRGRYVRFLVGTQPGAAEIAEIEIRGPRATIASVGADDQQAVRAAGNRPPSVTTTDANGARVANDATIQTPTPSRQAPEITINGETSRCSGSGRCTVVGKAPDIVEDCGDGTTTCTIKVSVAGGTASCDASGEDRKRNADRKRQTCTADASGGSVEVSDINP